MVILSIIRINKYVLHIDFRVAFRVIFTKLWIIILLPTLFLLMTNI